MKHQGDLSKKIRKKAKPEENESIQNVHLNYNANLNIVFVI